MSGRFFYVNIITASQNLEPAFKAVIWINICVCLPLTMWVIWSLYYGDRRDQVPVIYTNLLISNLIQLCPRIVWVVKVTDDQSSIISEFLFFFGMMGSLHFKMCIVLERYFFIAYPLMDCMRQTKGSVLVCVLVWAFNSISVSLAIVLKQYVHTLIFTLYPAPLLIFCLAGTIEALPTAPSVSTEEKRRVVGTLSLLLFNYFLFLFPAITLLSFEPHFIVRDIIFILFLLNPFVDLILFVFMQKGPVDRLLACLCCCSMNNTAADVAADPQCD